MQILHELENKVMKKGGNKESKEINATEDNDGKL
jgi:hypothetical protein